MNQLTIEPHAAEIVPGDISGGPNTSHTIILSALDALLEAVPPTARQVEYERATLERNVLGKETDGARRRTLRYLKELYLLRPDALLFRALRDLWPDDPDARPLLAGLCALARDTVFRASSQGIVRSVPGEVIASRDLADAVAERFPSHYSASTLAKIGRNVFSSWEQTGHLAAAERAAKVRTRVTCRPSNLAYALLLGHLEGIRGGALFETVWAQVLDQPKSQLLDLAFTASQRGLLEFRHAGGVIEVSFHELLRPFQGGAPLNYVDGLLEAYRKFVSLPWQQNLAPAQRVWMAVYPPELERRLRLHVQDFEVATKEAHHAWELIDVTTSFERWMAGHEYRDEYFGSPDLLETALPAFFGHLVSEVRHRLGEHPASDGVVGLLGTGTLFGLGDAVKVSALLNAVNDAIAGRLLVFFPGEQEGNSYRLLDARDGWNYLATPITPNGSSQ